MLARLEPDPPLCLGPGEVALVWEYLDLADGDLERQAGLLDADERRRAAAMAPLAQRRWKAARGLLRRALGRLMGLHPARVPLGREPGGKPYAQGGPCFSLTHSGPWMGLALSRFPVGLDLECGDGGDPLELAGEHFHPRERRLLSACPVEGRRVLFGGMWTAKEAWLKAMGQGLANPGGLAACGLRWRGRRLEPLGPAPLPACLAPVPAPGGAAAALAALEPVERLCVSAPQGVMPL